ncbi:MAG: NINE protein [Cyanobacteriota bacterium]|nr:NINE protein [Cyanobacteriota bacterium]
MSPIPSPGAPGAVLRGALEERRSVALSYGLWCLSLVGLCGIHRLYNRKPLTGLLWLFTFGLCGLGQFVDLVMIPGLVAGANRQLAPSSNQAAPLPPVDRQLLRLAREVGERGFTINDALLDLDLPPQMDSQALSQEIEKLLVANLLDVGNDDRGRVVYREP